MNISDLRYPHRYVAAVIILLMLLIIVMWWIAPSRRSGLITSLAFSPTGQTIAVAESNASCAGLNQWCPLSGALVTDFQLVSVPDGRVLRTFSGHTNTVWSVAYRAGNELLASGSSDGTVRLWRVQDGATIAVLQPPTPPTDNWCPGIKMVAFSPDGHRLASVGWNTLTMWSAQDQQILYTLPVGDRSIAFNANGRLFAVQGVQVMIEIHRVDTGALVATLAQPHATDCGITFHPKADIIAVCSDGRQVELYSIPNGQHVQTFHRAAWSVAFSPDGQLLAAALDGLGNFSENVDPDPTIDIWQVSNGEHRMSFPGHRNYIQSLVFSPDGQWLASGSWDGTVKFWQVR